VGSTRTRGRHRTHSAAPGSSAGFAACNDDRGDHADLVHRRAELRRLGDKVAAHGNVEVVRAGFLTYEHAGSPADFVYSRYALHHLPDFWKAVALARLRRMLRPGGILRLWDVVYDFALSEVEERIEAWCATAGDAVDRDWVRAELEEHVRDEHSTFTWLLEPMIERSGFEIGAAEHSDDGIFAKYVLRAA
jgi:SAM-dependent methyltransferase